MSNTVTGKIKEFVVDDDEHKAHIILITGTVNPAGPTYTNQPLKLTDDHDTAFNAMASACATAGIGDKVVELTFDGNFPTDTEIDRILVKS
jgi:hypothetical protein